MALRQAGSEGTNRLIDFNLKGTDGRSYSLGDVAGERGTLVMFICNHCPYVKAVIGRLNEDCRVLAEAGIGCIAIMPNDTAISPGDSFDNMKEFAGRHSLSFPYVIDETQEIARAYGALCTPDLFGFNREGNCSTAAASTAPAPGRPPATRSARCARRCCRSQGRKRDRPSRYRPSAARSNGEIEQAPRKP
jgi:peroxiredoxin